MIKDGELILNINHNDIEGKCVWSSKNTTFGH